MKHALRRTVVLSLLLASIHAATAGEADWPVTRGPSREPVPFQFRRRSLAELPRDFLEDAPACILYYGSNHLIESDGTVETITHDITRLNSRRGIESLGEYRQITFDPTYQKLILNEARIIKADGTIVPIEAKHLHVRDVSTDYHVYDRDKQLVISFPNLEVGDVYEVKWTTRGKNPEFLEFFTRTTFGDDTHPVGREEMRIRLPRDKTLKFAAVNGKLEPTVRDQGSEREYHWSIKNRPAPPAESDRPSRETWRLQVVASTFASWDEIGRWKDRLRADCWTCTPEIRKVIAQVAGSHKSDIDKARALTHWVRKHIRYISINSGGRGYTPRLPATVLASRYGDCKDQAQLLAVMLREIGLPVWLATLGAQDDGQIVEAVPSPWGTHAILMVEIAGKQHWIDTTTTQAGWDFLPRGDRDRVVYITRGEKIRVLRTPPVKRGDNLFEQTTDMRLQPDGTSRNVRTMTYHGLAALSRRETWRESPPGERRRAVTAELQDANSRSRLLSLNIDDKSLGEFDRPVNARMEFQIERHLTGESNKEGSITDSPVWGRLVAYTLDPERKLPLNLGVPFESRHRYRIHLPLAYRFDGRPADQEVTSKWGTFRLKVMADDAEPRRLEIDFHTTLDQVLIQPADFAAYQKFHEDVGKHYRVWLTMKPTQELADAAALEAEQMREPERISTGILARLYLENGKKADAQRVVRHALKSLPNETSLWELAVRSAAGAAEEEQTYQEMVKRFPKEDQYRLSLASTKVKRGDHAGARVMLFALVGHATPQLRGAAQYQLAKSAFAQNQPDAALRHLDAVRIAHPEMLATATALRFKAKVHEAKRQVAEAIESYQAALRAEPEADDVLAALVRLEMSRKQVGTALDYLRKYTVLAGNDLDRLVTAGNLHLDMGRLEDAVELAGRAERIEVDGRVHRLLGLIACRCGDWQAALAHLEKANADAATLEARLRCRIALGDLRSVEQEVEQAGKVAEPTLGLRQAQIVALNLLLRHANMKKDVPASAEQHQSLDLALGALVCAEHARAENRPAVEVEKLVARSLAQGVEVGPAYALRGLLALEKGKLAAARDDAERALELSPDDARAYMVRGRVRLQRGERGALHDLRQAAKWSKRKDAVILHWLAAALHEASRDDRALAIQREAARLAPRDRDIAEQLRDLEAQATRP